MHVFNANFKGETEWPISNPYNYQFFNFKLNMYQAAGRTKQVPELSWVAIREEALEKVGDIDENEKQAIKIAIQEEREQLKELIKSKSKKTEIAKIVKNIEK